LNRPKRRKKVIRLCDQHGITPENVDEMIDQMMKRFI
jgi:hypothetical protein